MNIKSSIFSSLIAFAVIITTFFFNSCTKEGSVQLENSFEDEFGRYTKELTVYDADKENSAILKIGSNDESILNMWTSDNFELVPIKEGQTFDEAMKEYFPTQEEENPNDDEIDDDSVSDENDEVAAEIFTIMVKKELQDGIRNVALTIKPPYDDDMRGWKYGTHYSIYEEGNTVTMTVYGHNRWHRGYWACYWRKTPSHGWGTIVGEWKRIRNGESISKSKTPCYVMKGKRKYKKGSVTIEFEN